MKYLYGKTLGRAEMVSFIRFPKRRSRLPTVLGVDEVHRLLQALTHPLYQTIAMVPYAAGLRITEALALEVGDIDGERGVIRVRKGKGNKEGEVKLSVTLYAWPQDHWDRYRPVAPLLFGKRQTGKAPCVPSVAAAHKKAAAAALIKKRVSGLHSRVSAAKSPISSRALK